MIGYNYYIYFTTNPRKTTLYIGITNDMVRRLDEHFQNAGLKETFAGRYFCYNLVYYEMYSDVNVAIAREKELKGWTRAKKDILIKRFNPGWRFLNNEV